MNKRRVIPISREGLEYIHQIALAKDMVAKDLVTEVLDSLIVEDIEKLQKSVKIREVKKSLLKVKDEDYIKLLTMKGNLSAGQFIVEAIKLYLEKEKQNNMSKKEALKKNENER